MDLFEFLLITAVLNGWILLLVVLLATAPASMSCQSDPSEEELIENVILTGMKARDEMDRISSDFLAKQVQLMLNEPQRSADSE